MRLVISRSGAAFELGPGKESYKRRWGPTAAETITASVVYPTWRQRIGWWTRRAQDAQRPWPRLGLSATVAIPMSTPSACRERNR